MSSTWTCSSPTSDDCRSDTDGRENQYLAYQVGGNATNSRKPQPLPLRNSTCTFFGNIDTAYRIGAVTQHAVLIQQESAVTCHDRGLSDIDDHQEKKLEYGFGRLDE